jgi:hypothetical protein
MNETIAWFAALLTTAVEDDLAAWVPAKILVAAMIAVSSVGLTVVGVVARALLKRLDKLEETVETATAEIAKLANFATREQVAEMLGGLGNRFDERHGKLREELGRLDIRLARLEERAAARRTKA